MFRRVWQLIAITFLLLVSFAIWREVDRRIQEWETVSKLSQYAVLTSESNSPPWLDDVVGTRVASWLFPPRVTEAILSTTSSEPDAAAMAWLGQLPRLESVEITGSNQFSDSGIAHLRKLRKLTHLSVWDTDLSDLGLVHVGKLDRLKGLTLAYVPVTDEGLKHLTVLTNLESLQLLSTHVTQRGVTDLRKALPHCKIVALSIARPDES